MILTKKANNNISKDELRVSAGIFVALIIPGRLCGLVIRVPGYRSRILGSIPGAARVTEK
jgi:hypothetical protein